MGHATLRIGLRPQEGDRLPRPGSQGQPRHLAAHLVLLQRLQRAAPGGMHLIELVKKLDPRTGQTSEENPTFLKAGDAAVIKCKPTKPFCVENAKEFPQLGRFAIRDMGQTIAAGMCIDVVKKQFR